MFVVGLTGGVGSGKSTVAELLARHNVYLIDADLVAREVVGRGTYGLTAIVERFGEQILNTQGELDRAHLASIVFSDPESLAALNAIVHPLVRASIRSTLDSLHTTTEIVLLVVPLFVESQQYECDRLVVVDVVEEIAVARVVAQRGWSVEAARARAAAQIDRAKRVEAADYIIDNNGTYAELIEAVEAAWAWLETQSPEGTTSFI